MDARVLILGMGRTAARPTTDCSSANRASWAWTRTNPRSRSIAARLLRRRGFRGVVVAHTMFADEAREVSTAGADHTYLTMTGAGIGLAEQAWRALEARAAAR